MPIIHYNEEDDGERALPDIEAVGPHHIEEVLLTQDVGLTDADDALNLHYKEEDEHKDGAIEEPLAYDL